MAVAGAGDNSNLYNYIDHVHVWGTNIEPPESAKHALKPWDQRHSLETWVESGVDDQVRNIALRQDDYQHPFYVPCAYSEHLALHPTQ